MAALKSIKQATPTLAAIVHQRLLIHTYRIIFPYFEPWTKRLDRFTFRLCIKCSAKSHKSRSGRGSTRDGHESRIPHPSTPSCPDRMEETLFLLRAPDEDSDPLRRNSTPLRIGFACRKSAPEARQYACANLEQQRLLSLHVHFHPCKSYRSQIIQRVAADRRDSSFFCPDSRSGI